MSAHSAYRVTSSEQDGIPVDSLLIDKGVRLRQEWTYFDTETGTEYAVVGKRVGRLCAVCREKHHRAANLGHVGPHGSARFVADDVAVGGAS